MRSGPTHTPTHPLNNAAANPQMLCCGSIMTDSVHEKICYVEESLPFSVFKLFHPDGHEFVCSPQVLYQNSSLFKLMIDADPSVTELKLPEALSYDSGLLGLFLKALHLVKGPTWDASKVIMIAHYFGCDELTEWCFEQLETQHKKGMINLFEFISIYETCKIRRKTDWVVPKVGVALAMQGWDRKTYPVSAEVLANILQESVNYSDAMNIKVTNSGMTIAQTPELRIRNCFSVFEGKWHFDNQPKGSFIAFDFKEPVSFASSTITADRNGPKWRVEGSTDQSSWDKLSPDTPVREGKTTLTLSHNKCYRFYRYMLRSLSAARPYYTQIEWYVRN